MEMLLNAVLGDLVSRSTSFMFAKYERREAEELQRLRRHRGGARSGGSSPTGAVLRQLRASVDLLEAITCR